MKSITAEDLGPYPGEFLKEDLETRIVRTNLMLAIDYLRQNDEKGALECLNNIYLARTKALPKENQFQKLLRLQKIWKDLMDYFCCDTVCQKLCSRLGMG
jgi:hypothetical protein